MTSCTSCEAVNPLPPCPNRMEDGRAFTDYRPRCAVNAELFNLLAKADVVKSSYESRMFLQHNADQIMISEKNRAVDNIAPCAPCFKNSNDSEELLARYVVRCNGASCTRNEVNPRGIGDDRAY